MEEKKLKPISSLSKQIIHKRIAEMVTQPEACYFYFNEVIKLLRSEVGDEPLKQRFGKDYERVCLYLVDIGRKIGTAKGYLDAIKAKELDLNDINLPAIREYNKMNAELGADLILGICFKTLLDFSEIKNFTIPNDYFKEARRKTEKKFNWEDKD